jgi:hypothetical protein
VGLIIHLTIGQLLSLGRGVSDSATDEHLRSCPECRAIVDEAAKGEHPSPGNLAAFVAGELEEGERQRVAAHLAGCHFCRRAQREMTQEPPRPSPVQAWQSGRFSAAPAFHGTYSAVLGHGGDVRFISETQRPRQIAAARVPSQQWQEKLSRIVTDLEVLDDITGGTDVAEQRGLYEQDITVDEPLHSLQLQALSEQHAARQSIHELRVAASRAMDKFRMWESALQRWAGEPLSFASAAVSLPLGPVVHVAIRGTIINTDLHIMVDARWASGTPGRNIDVRAISLGTEGTQTARTDDLGHTELRLKKEQYKIEFEHEVHGGVSLVLDLTLSHGMQ